MLKKRWPAIIAAITAAIYLGKAGLFFYQNPGFTDFWDWPGHLQKATIADWPWKSGWDTTFWGGYPTWVYPNGYHLILKLFITIFKSDFWGAAVLTLIIFGLQLHGLHRFVFGRLGDKKKKLASLAFAATVAVMAYSGGSFMGSFWGTLVTGGGPGALATAIFLYFMAAPSGILLGLLFLVHPLTAMVAAGYLIVAGTMALMGKNQDEFKKCIFSFLTGLVIGLPWILTQLDPSFSSTAVNLPSNPDAYPWILIIILILILVNDRKKISPLILTMIGFGLLAVVPTQLIRRLEHLGIRGLHFYRFIWFFNLSFAAITASLVSDSWEKKVKNPTLAVAFLIILTAITFGPQPKPQVDLKLDIAPVADFSGRVMDASRHAFKLDFPQTVEHALVKETNLVGSSRWIFESGSRGLMFYALKNGLEPQSFKDGTYLSFFNDSFGKPRREANIREMADLLGVNYVTYTSENPAPERENIWKVGEISWTDSAGQNLRLNYLMEKISDSPLVGTIDYIPEADSKVNLGDWWLGTGDKNKLITDNREQQSKDINLSMPEVSGVEIKPEKITFKVAGNRPAPVVVRFSYSPYWQAETSGEGSVSQPAWITPGNMLVYGWGNITLTWKPPIYASIFGRVSAAVAALTFIFAVIAGCKRYK